MVNSKLYVVFFLAGLSVGILICSQFSQAVAPTRDTIKIVRDIRMGCEYISINEQPFIPRLSSIGTPSCDYFGINREPLIDGDAADASP